MKPTYLTSSGFRAPASLILVYKSYKANKAYSQALGLGAVLVCFGLVTSGGRQQRWGRRDQVALAMLVHVEGQGCPVRPNFY